MKLLFILFLVKISSEIGLGAIGGAAMGGGGGASGGGGEGAEAAGITIAPPPLPQEILPPKPVIVAPLLIKQHRKRKRVAIYRAGPTLPPFGFDTPPIYPSATDFNGFPDYRKNRKLVTNLKNLNFPLNNRNLTQQIVMENTSNEDPEYTKKLSVAGGPTSRWSLSPKFEREKDNELAQINFQKYGDDINRFKEIKDKLDDLVNSISDMQKSEKENLLKLDTNIKEFSALKGKAKSMGFKNFI